MLRRLVQPVLCSLIVASWAGSSVFAQLPPPISPWMGMFDRSRNTSGIDNYNRVVRPHQDMLKAYAAQESQLQAQQQALRVLQQGGDGYGSSGGVGVRDLAGVPSGSSSGGSMLLSAPRELPRTQRNPAGFNQYLHYYPPGSLPRQPVPNFSSTGRRR